MANDSAAPPDWHKYARLPDGPWIPLRAVLSFANTGWCEASLSGDSAVLLAIKQVKSGLPYYRPGSFGGSETPSDELKYEAQTKFQRLMLEAARSARLSFQGHREKGAATEREDIPTMFFAKRCIFGDDGKSAIERADRTGTWHECAIARAGLLKWLHDEFPTIAKLHDEFDMAASTLPAGYIWLGDAFETAWSAIEDGKRHVLAASRQVPDPVFSADVGGSWQQSDPDAVREMDSSRRKVEKQMRTSLAHGWLRAFIRDPQTGEPGELANREAWMDAISFSVPGLETKIHHLTCPGPQTNGRPVFVLAVQIERFIERYSPARHWEEHGNLIAEIPWTLPAKATPERVSALGDTDWLMLSPVVSFLAFGEPDPPSDMHPFIANKYRIRAAKTLFAAAGKSHLKLFGTCAMGGLPGQIPAAIFADALTLTGDGHGFEADLNAVSDEVFFRMRDSGPDGRHWRGVRIERLSLDGWLSKPTGQAQSARRKGGRKPVVDWQVVEREAVHIRQQEGPFDPAVPEWNCQARLEERLLAFCQKRFGLEPGVATLRSRIPLFLATYQRELET